MSAPDHAEFPEGGAVGRSLPRSAASRLAGGRGRYVDDIVLPRMAYLAFLRSPVAHGRIVDLDVAAARDCPGVIRVVTAADLEGLCPPLQTRLETVPQHRSAPQPALAGARVVWQGQPVAAVVARSRAEAEDALEAILLDIEDLPPVVDPAAALEEGAPRIHDELDDNLALSMRVQVGDSTIFETADHVFEHVFELGRQAGVPLEPRGLIADFDPAAGTLTVYQSHQSPHLAQALYARHFGIAEHKVRVIAPDVGGAFGVKMHLYPDEVATVAIARLVGRPVKYICDRMEAFLSDVHARDFRVVGRIAVGKDGKILGFGADAVCALGAYSTFPRSSLGDAIQTVTLLGGPYAAPVLDASVRAAYQTKVPTGVIRGVGQPIACTVTEQLVDIAAAELGLDPIDFRRRNYIPAEALPTKTTGGMVLQELSLDACLDKILSIMNYDGLRAEQERLREQGVYRGVGVVTFLEQTGPGAGLYGPAGLPVTAQDSCALRFDPDGTVRGAVGCTDQGQGTLAGIEQIVADTLGIPYEDVRIEAGDSAGPQGGGAWASRGLTIGGEAAHRAALHLRERVLTVAAAMLQTRADRLDIRAATIVEAEGGAARMSVAEAVGLAYFRQDLLPADTPTELSVSESFILRDAPYFMANGVQASHLEIDIETGAVTLLGHWVVEDCGRVVNPMLVDEQMRGGVVMGLGSVLFEHCLYDEEGQMLNASFADYLLPSSAEMPDIVVGHVETLAKGTALGLKGAGEAGTVGAPAAVWCAVNDALRPFGARISRQPVTPEVILRSISKVGG